LPPPLPFPLGGRLENGSLSAAAAAAGENGRAGQGGPAAGHGAQQGAAGHAPLGGCGLHCFE
jgi:hypothetical protein